MAKTPPPGWYVDPEHPTALRWWDGTRWAAPLPRPVARPMWPWSTGVSRRTYLLLWVGAVALLEALGVAIGRLAIGFNWITSIAAALPGPVVLVILGGLGWSQRPHRSNAAS
jgi:hypothetical protein